MKIVSQETQPESELTPTNTKQPTPRLHNNTQSQQVHISKSKTYLSTPRTTTWK